MTVQELIPPYRQTRIAIVLHAFDIPWLKGRGDVRIRQDLVYADGTVVAKIIFDRPVTRPDQWHEAKRR